MPGDGLPPMTVMPTSGIVLRAPVGSWSAGKPQLHSGGSEEPSPRRVTWETIACDTQHAVDRGDTRELYKLARRLGAVKPTPAPGVKLKDGTLANDDDEGLAMWAEHVFAFLGGKQVRTCTRSCNQDTSTHAKTACRGTRRDRE